MYSYSKIDREIGMWSSISGDFSLTLKPDTMETCRPSIVVPPPSPNVGQFRRENVPPSRNTQQCPCGGVRHKITGIVCVTVKRMPADEI